MHKSAVPSKPLAWPEKIVEGEAGQSEAKQCPHCATPIAAGATRCTDCGRELPTKPAAAQDLWEGYDV